MLVSFVKNTPALMIKKERVLVAGDLHIGMHLKLRERGFYFQRATERMAESLLDAYRRSGARGMVLLGDVKESIGTPRFAEYREIKTFFDMMAGMDIRIVRGNHDGGLERVLSNVGFRAAVEREVLVGDVALTHGNSWPSGDAMRKRYIVVGHGHYALMVNGALEKVWLVSGVTRRAAKRYAEYNKSIRLIASPSFNSLIGGSALAPRTKNYLPTFRNGFFDFEKSDVYGVDGRLMGKAGKLMSGGF